MMESNTTSFPQDQWKRSTTRRFLNWLFSWKTQRKLLFGLVAFITLVALFVGVENWRGHRAWNRYAVELQAAGKPLHFTEIIPPPVPDEQNFVATPYWTNLRYNASQPFTAQRDTNRWPQDASIALANMSRVRASTDAGKKPYHYLQLTDLPALELAFRQLGQTDPVPDPNLPPPTDVEARRKSAQAVLKFLQPYDSVFEELRQANGRPKARFAIQYDTDNPAMILLPHLAVMKSTIQTLKLKAVAELAAGNSDQALEDIKVMFRLADANKEEPTLISYLVRIACVQITVGVIWEGLVFHAWTGPQLEILQAALQRYDFIQETGVALTGERAFGNGVFDYLMRIKCHSGEAVGIFGDSDDRMFCLVFSFTPRGWLYMEKVNYNRLFDAFIEWEPSSGDPRIRPDLLNTRTAELDKLLSGSGPVVSLLEHRIFAGLLLPALGKVTQKGGRMQAYVEMGALACALERHRLARSSYPASLAELAPEFINRIPNDVILDQPYRYQRKTDDAFALYSVGLDQTDHGGIETKPDEGDWVWRSLSP